MTNNEVKILSNMVIILSKIEIKDTYLEEDYFNIFQLVDGYKKIEKYFQNKDIINKLLSKNIEDDKLYDLIRFVRNRYSHIDKHDKIEKLILLQTKVNKEYIQKLVNEIKIEMDNIFVRDLKGDGYKLAMNTRTIINMFELMRSVINASESKNEFDKYSKDLLKPIINNFEYDSSTVEEYDKLNEQIIEIYKSVGIKDGIIEQYGEDNYNELLRMLIDDNYTDKQAIDLMNRIKNIELINKE